MTQNNKDKKTNVVASASHITSTFEVSYSDNEKLQHLYSLFSITVVFKWRRMYYIWER